MTLSLKIIHGGHPEPVEDVRRRTLEVLSHATAPLARRDISNRVHGTDKIGAGSTYAALGTLRQLHLIEQTASGRYRITTAGRAALALEAERHPAHAPSYVHALCARHAAEFGRDAFGDGPCDGCDIDDARGRD